MTPDSPYAGQYDAGQYARSRPTYPPELFRRLAALIDRHDLAWDCATGNGQAAGDLAAYFARVIATDVSAEQLRHAPAHPRIEYLRRASRMLRTQRFLR